MKWFWGIMVLVAIGASALLIQRGVVDAGSSEQTIPQTPAIDPGTRDTSVAVPTSQPIVTGPKGDPPGSPSKKPPLDPSPPEDAPFLVSTGDRSVLIEGRFVVSGRGVEADPFQVPWDLLISAGEDYKPESNQREIPRRVQMLEGRTVSISGYLAAPLLVEETNEILVMFNRWDGCCIGTPPTPFDAVEVRLRSPVKLTGRHVIHYGTVTGTLRIDPFLIGDMLVSMYRLEDGKLDWTP